MPIVGRYGKIRKRFDRLGVYLMEIETKHLDDFCSHDRVKAIEFSRDTKIKKD